MPPFSNFDLVSRVLENLCTYPHMYASFYVSRRISCKKPSKSHEFYTSLPSKSHEFYTSLPPKSHDFYTSVPSHSRSFHGRDNIIWWPKIMDFCITESRCPYQCQLLCHADIFHTGTVPVPCRHNSHMHGACVMQTYFTQARCLCHADIFHTGTVPVWQLTTHTSNLATFRLRTAQRLFPVRS